MKKTLGTFIAAALLSGTSAQAAFIDTNVFTPDGLTQLGSNVRTIDFSSEGVAVVTGAGPFGGFVPPVGTIFDVRVMTDFVAFRNSVGGNAAVPGNPLSGGLHELTAVAQFQEMVVISAVNSATFVILPVGTISLYYDTTPDINYAAGTGFDNGDLIYRASVLFGNSSFTVSDPPGPGTDPGSGTGSVNLTAITTTIDSDVFPQIGALLVSLVNPEGQASFPPPTTFPTSFFSGGDAFYAAYPVDLTCTPTCDLPLRFDGSARFVPEPNTLALLGLAAILIGGGLSRRRKVA